MDKQQLLQSIEMMAKQNALSLSEVESAFKRGSVGSSERDGMKKSFGIAKVLYLIGALVVVIGIILLVAQNWRNMPTFTKILITLGSGIASYIAASLFKMDERTKGVSVAFTIISAILIPVGLGIYVSENNITMSGSGFSIMVSSVMVVLELIQYALFKESYFIFLIIIFASWLYYAVIAYFMPTEIYRMSYDIWNYVTVVFGIVYLLLSYSFKGTSNKNLTPMLTGIGNIAILGATFILGGIWELIFPALVIALIFQSVYVRSRPTLFLGALFTLAYIIKITGKYFADSLSWPIMLVLIGFVFIGVGYLTVYLNRKYMGVRV